MMTATVLLVEDEPLIQIEVEAALVEAGFDVLLASSAAEALPHFDAADQIRAMITDIDLGGGPTGWDIARQARERIPALPVIYVSAMSSADWTSQGVPNSVMIAKPFASAQIVVALSTQINKTDAS